MQCRMGVHERGTKTLSRDYAQWEKNDLAQTKRWACLGATLTSVDYRNWDWLPEAAVEMDRYLRRLLTEASITAHVVSARAKSITSFQEKCDSKKYDDPLKSVTDTVAVRIITYSVTDRDRARELIRGRFTAKEDRNPGEDKPLSHRGYDCQHLVVTGEGSEADHGWLIAGGKLAQYFATFGGLEIQIRTVAAHAWAEFEHSRRYKGQPYKAVGDQDQKTIDQLFGAASDARRALDETFVAIDMVLANPTSSTSSRRQAEEDGSEVGSDGQHRTRIDPEGSITPVDHTSLLNYLAGRFPEDVAASEMGVLFACQLVEACGLKSIEDLSEALDTIDGDQVRRLMDTATPVTTVRRLDDELLAKFGEAYVDRTGTLGRYEKRRQQLRWRYDRLRNKVSTLKYSAYAMEGTDCPEELRNTLLPAARAVREVARLVADRQGSHAAHIPEAIAASPDDLLASARARMVKLEGGEHLWVSTNLRREASENLMNRLLHQADGLDLRITIDGRLVAPVA